MDLVLLERFLWLAHKVKAEALPYNQNVYFNECGTPFCLAGHGTADPVLRAAGLRSEPMSGTPLGAGCALSPTFGIERYIGCEALQRLLGANEKQTDYIFGSVHEIADACGADVRTVDTSIDGVINRITKVMEGYLADC